MVRAEKSQSSQVGVGGRMEEEVYIRTRVMRLRDTPFTHITVLRGASSIRGGGGGGGGSVGSNSSGGIGAKCPESSV